MTGPSTSAGGDEGEDPPDEDAKKDAQKKYNKRKPARPRIDDSKPARCPKHAHLDKPAPDCAGCKMALKRQSNSVSQRTTRDNKHVMLDEYEHVLCELTKARTELDEANARVRRAEKTANDYLKAQAAALDAFRDELQDSRASEQDLARAQGQLDAIQNQLRSQRQINGVLWSELQRAGGDLSVQRAMRALNFSPDRPGTSAQAGVMHDTVQGLLEQQIDQDVLPAPAQPIENQLCFNSEPPHPSRQTATSPYDATPRREQQFPEAALQPHAQPTENQDHQSYPTSARATPFSPPSDIGSLQGQQPSPYGTANSGLRPQTHGPGPVDSPFYDQDVYFDCEQHGPLFVQPQHGQYEPQGFPIGHQQQSTHNFDAHPPSQWTAASIAPPQAFQPAAANAQQEPQWTMLQPMQLLQNTAVGVIQQPRNRLTEGEGPYADSQTRTKVVASSMS